MCFEVYCRQLGVSDVKIGDFGEASPTSVNGALTEWPFVPGLMFR